MRFIILSFLAAATLSSFAQHDTKGIPFVHGKKWNELVLMAKKEKKYIFVDCFTTWCGPCKMMSAEVFTDASVGDFFKKNFISLKAQMDKTKNDPADVRKLYADFEKLEKENNIQYYPTFLFFSPEGKLVHKFIGGMPVKEFIEKSNEALKPGTQYYTLKAQFKLRQKDAEYLRGMIKAASACYDDATPYFNAYAATQTNMFSAENLPMVEMLAGNTELPGFKLIATNPDRYDEVTSPGKAEELIVDIVTRSMYSSVYPDGAKEPNQEALSSMEKKYPTFFQRIKQYFSVMCAERNNLWDMYSKELLAYMQSYGKKINSHNQLNDIAWTVFENCKNEEVLKAAIEWSKWSLAGDDENNSAYLDTYANLMYKLGMKEEALATERKAFEYAKENQEDFKATLEMMEKGEKTWKE